MQSILPIGTPQTDDFSSVSELPGNRITREAARMLYTRYAYAANLSTGKDVLEVACGAGHGLGLLASQARRLVAGDCTEVLLRAAREHHNSHVPLVRLDAQALPFASRSFDLVLLFEAIYYLPDAGEFLRECWRILRPGGSVVICSVNKQWSGFSPSPFSTRYYSGDEFRELLLGHGFEPQVFVAFPDTTPGIAHKAIALVRYLAVKLRLIPKTMRKKEWLKRLFYGDLILLHPEFDFHGLTAAELVPISRQGSKTLHKVIYAAGKRRS